MRVITPPDVDGEDAERNDNAENRQVDQRDQLGDYGKANLLLLQIIFSTCKHPLHQQVKNIVAVMLHGVATRNFMFQICLMWLYRTSF